MTRPALRIGLTGGAAAGKSTVAAAFADRGVPVFSADAVARDLTAPGAPLLHTVRAAFGDGVFADDGALDRAALAARVFGDGATRRRLEAILHPPIRDALAAAARGCTAEYCVLEVPLLGQQDVGTLVDRVLLVDLPAALQQDRLLARPAMDAERARQVLDAQATPDERRAFADDVFTNSGSPAEIGPAVDALHALYVDIARHGDADRPGLRLPAR